MALILSAVTWGERMTLKGKLKPANSGRFSCQPQPAERTKKLPCRDVPPSPERWKCKPKIVFRDALPVAKTLIFRHLMADAPNILLYITSFDYALTNNQAKGRDSQSGILSLIMSGSR